MPNNALFVADLQETTGTTISGTVAGTKAGGNVVPTTGPGGLWPSAITFDGVDDQIAFSGMSASGNNYTFLIWLRMSGNQSQYFSPMFSRGSGINVTGMHFPTATAPTRLGYVNNIEYSFAGPVIPHNKWVLCAVAIQSGATKVYVISDAGTDVATDTATFGSIDYVSNLTIGADTFGGRRFTGALAGARVFGYTLTQADIEAYYALGQGAGTTCLVRYMGPGFQPGASTTILDESGHAFHATLMGGRTRTDIAETVRPGIGGTHAAHLNGSTDYLAIPDLSGYLGPTFGFCGWCKLDLSTPTDSSMTGLANLGPRASGGGTHYVWTNGSHDFSLGRYTSASTPNRVSTTNVFDRSVYHHLAVSNQPGANGYQIFINGSAIYQTTGTTTPYWYGSAWEIGRSRDDQFMYMFDGSMWDMQIHNVPFTPSMLTGIMAAKDTPAAYGPNGMGAVFSPVINPCFSPSIFK